MTIALAVVSYHAFEEPILRLKRYFAYETVSPISVVADVPPRR